MKLISNSFKQGDIVNIKYTAYGQNISPHLKWDDIPEGTKSFALYLVDEDAPIPGVFWHWQIVNIDQDVREIPEGSSPNLPFKAFEKENGADKPGYYGPQPPVGAGFHRYKFILVALDVPTIDVKVNADKGMTAFMVQMHELAQSTLEVKYEKK